MGIADWDWGFGPIPNPQSPFISKPKLIYVNNFRKINENN